jgi:hypothetical protein
MLARIVYCVVGGILLVGPVVAQPPPPREDATKAEVEKLRAQAQALLAQAQALEAQQARTDRQAAEKYMQEFADSCLEALLKGDYEAVIPVMGEELKDGFQISKTNVSNRGNLNVVRRYGIAVSGYKITKAVIAPSREEAIFCAEVSGKSTAPDEKAKDRKAAVTLRVQKESGRYVLGFLSAVVEK